MLTDDMLRQAAAESSTAFVRAVEQDYDDNRPYSPSHQFEKKMKRLTRRANHPNLYRSAQRVASVVLAILLAGSAWLTVDVQAREAFFGWVKEVYEELYVYRLTGEVVEQGTENNYALGWIPDGYTEMYEGDLGGTFSVIYNNDLGQMLDFSYTTNTEQVDWFLYGENMERYQVEIGSSVGDFLYSTDDQTSNALVWMQDDQTGFYLSGFFDEDELILMAENIVKK